jgi:hypothetical protein
MRRAEHCRIGFDQTLACYVVLDGNRGQGAMRAQPFYGDRAATGADVPQQLARYRAQRGQSSRANLTLGQLPVVLERLVGQAGRKR